MAGKQRVVRGELARECLDALRTDRCFLRATFPEEKLSAQPQALRHHPRPIACRSEDLRLLQDEEGEFDVAPTRGEVSQYPISAQGALVVPRRSERREALHHQSIQTGAMSRLVEQLCEHDGSSSCHRRSLPETTHGAFVSTPCESRRDGQSELFSPADRSDRGRGDA